MKHSIVLVTIAKRENNYMDEWINHHLGLGFDKIVVYDNSNLGERTINTDTKAKYQDAIQVIDFCQIKSAQFIAYNDAYKRFSNYDYIMFLDIDEFLILKKHSTVKELISSIGFQFETMRFNWDMYDDSDIIERDISIPVMQDFTRRAVTEIARKLNNRTKQILKTNIKDIVIDSSHTSYKMIDGKFRNLVTITPSGLNITNQLPNKKCLDINVVEHDVAKVNHYITKSLGEFVYVKSQRGDVAFGDRNLTLENYYWSWNQKTPEKMKYLDRKFTKTNCFVTPLPSNVNRINLPSRGDIVIHDWRDEKCNFYHWYFGNRHHWTMNSAWEFAKRISTIEGFKINSNFNFYQKSIDEPEYSSKQLNYIDIVGRFSCWNLTTGEQFSAQSSKEMGWKDPNKWYHTDMNTQYHKMFYGSHSVSITENKMATLDESILVVSDSMSIALCFHLINTFRKCVIFDARHITDMTLCKCIRSSDFDRCFILCTQDRMNVVLKWFDYLNGGN